jgi:hypothetical protein
VHRASVDRAPAAALAPANASANVVPRKQGLLSETTAIGGGDGAQQLAGGLVDQLDLTAIGAQSLQL